MKELSRALALTIVAALLTAALLGFVLINGHGIEGKFYCGTMSPVMQSLQTDSIASKGEKLFQANCSVCHRMDRKMIGPPLRGVYAKRDSVWLRQMIVNGNKLVERSDKIAVALYEEYNRIYHVAFTNLSKGEVDAVMHYLKVSPSAIEKPE